MILIRLFYCPLDRVVCSWARPKHPLVTKAKKLTITITNARTLAYYYVTTMLLAYMKVPIGEALLGLQLGRHGHKVADTTGFISAFSLSLYGNANSIMRRSRDGLNSLFVTQGTSPIPPLVAKYPHSWVTKFTTRGFATRGEFVTHQRKYFTTRGGIGMCLSWLMGNFSIPPLGASPLVEELTRPFFASVEHWYNVLRSQRVPYQIQKPKCPHDFPFPPHFLTSVAQVHKKYIPSFTWR